MFFYCFFFIYGSEVQNLEFQAAKMAALREREEALEKMKANAPDGKINWVDTALLARHTSYKWNHNGIITPLSRVFHSLYMGLSASHKCFLGL